MSDERLHWADVAKAIAVALVVLYHVSTTGMVLLTSGTNGAEEAASALSRWLLPVRMPLFFLVSGIFAGNALRRPWRAVLRPRVLDHTWVFVLWTLLYAVPYAYAYTPGAVGATVPRALSWVLTLGGAYWYLPLLVTFFVLAKAGRRVWPLLLALGGVAYLVWFQVPLPEPPPLRDLAVTARRFLNFAVFFLLGAFARPIVERWARVPLWLAAAAAVAYVPGALAIYGPTRSPHVQAVTALLTVLGITALLGLSRLIAGWEPGRRLGRYLAERTLPIYLVHSLALALLLWLTPSLPPVGPAVSVGLIVVLVVALTWLSCALFDATRAPVPWLYRSPGRTGELEQAVRR